MAICPVQRVNRAVPALRARNDAGSQGVAPPDCASDVGLHGQLPPDVRNKSGTDLPG